MIEHIKKYFSIFFYGICVFSLILLYRDISLNNENRRLQVLLDSSNKIVSSYLNEQDNQERRYKKARYMIAYIRANYKKVPYVVAETIGKSIVREAKDYNIKPELIFAMIEAESSFNPYLVSKQGCRGLMQVNLSVWEEELNINKTDLHDIPTGISCGVKILKQYLDQTDSIEEALYLYVGKDRKYKTKVLTNMGKYLLFKEDYLKGLPLTKEDLLKIVQPNVDSFDSIIMDGSYYLQTKAGCK